jgi:hypothetical protein
VEIPVVAADTETKVVTVVTPSGEETWVEVAVVVAVEEDIKIIKEYIYDPLLVSASITSDLLFRGSLSDLLVIAKFRKYSGVIF